MSKISNWVTEKYIGLKHREEEAQGLAEYGLILALIAAVCVLALVTLGGQINTVLESIGGSFTAGGGEGA